MHAMASDDAHKIRIIEDPWATFRHVIEAVAIVAAGLWAFYIFVYQEKIKPSGEPPGSAKRSRCRASVAMRAATSFA